MKLYTHPRSPFARKVMMFAHIHNIKLDAHVVGDPDVKHGYTNGDNPLGKIPALEWQPGQFLFDSPVICEHLDNLSSTPLLPKDRASRFKQMHLHALVDGLGEANMNLMFERLRPKDLHWGDIINRHEAAIKQTILRLETMTKDLGTEWSYGNVGLVAVLDFLSFRATVLKWREIAPRLADWHEGFMHKPAYQDTFGYGAEL